MLKETVTQEEEEEEEEVVMVVVVVVVAGNKQPAMHPNAASDALSGRPNISAPRPRVHGSRPGGKADWGGSVGPWMKPWHSMRTCFHQRCASVPPDLPAFLQARLPASTLVFQPVYLPAHPPASLPACLPSPSLLHEVAHLLHEVAHGVVVGVGEEEVQPVHVARVLLEVVHQAGAVAPHLAEGREEEGEAGGQSSARQSRRKQGRWSVCMSGTGRAARNISSCYIT